MKLIALVFCMLPVAAMAQNVSIHPAAQSPEAKAPADPAPQWQRKPDDVPKQFLANIQSRIGLLETSEMEARAKQTVAEAENARLQTELANAQSQLRELHDQVPEVLKGK
jgi:hypothetical protein